MSAPRTLALTGASSGIGRALALAHAQGGARLLLVGRDAVRLGETAAACAARGASVETAALDVRDRAGLKARLEAFDAQAPVDRVIACAGVAIGSSAAGALEDAERAYALLDVNVIGALNTILPLLPAMRARRSGQIALVASIAGLAPLPDAIAYSASKAALISYGIGLRDRLRPDGVKVSVVCPGFVTSPMSEAFRGRKPFELSAERAAAIVMAGLARDRGLIAFPFALAFVAKLQALAPESLRRLAMRGLRFHIEPRDEAG